MDEGNVLPEHPYVLVQLEQCAGGWRIGVDFRMMTAEEAIETLEAVLDDLRDQEWI